LPSVQHLDHKQLQTISDHLDPVDSNFGLGSAIGLEGPTPTADGLGCDTITPMPDGTEQLELM